ncbi:hypothetical protein BO71DRAFT_6448 [Aspergillus ellipticus CBS 707.79]|uniref:Uncharacterized protein n=1 Tax=Aspergillus ellipticus CBS 707.79 TaxID=1448320 RepID=A0A319D7E7_9EURO|nr:hypothetical protein BO71DRAFT_6448 [Aspergillus ellipticus CBS 707.79]
MVGMVNGTFKMGATTAVRSPDDRVREEVTGSNVEEGDEGPLSSVHDQDGPVGRGGGGGGEMTGSACHWERKQTGSSLAGTRSANQGGQGGCQKSRGTGLGDPGRPSLALRRPWVAVGGRPGQLKR